MHVGEFGNRDNTCRQNATGDIAVEKDALDTHKIGAMLCEQLPDNFVQFSVKFFTNPRPFIASNPKSPTSNLATLKTVSPSLISRKNARKCP